jgi:hypothetical protein
MSEIIKSAARMAVDHGLGWFLASGASIVALLASLHFHHA